MIGIWKPFPGDDARPGIININVTRIIEHIQCQAPWRTHIDFQSTKLPSLSLSKKLKVKEPLVDSKFSQDTPPYFFQIRRYLAQSIVINMIIREYRFHNPSAIDKRIKENRVPIYI